MKEREIVIIGSGGIGRNLEQMEAIKKAGKLLVLSNEKIRKRTKAAGEAIEELKRSYQHFDVEAKSHKSKFHS